MINMNPTKKEANKRQRTTKGQSKKGNQEKLATQCTQGEKKTTTKQKHDTICV